MHPSRRFARVAAVLVLAVAVPMLLPPDRAVAADRTVVFSGAGWGHGVGLSQYGAYGMSREGATAVEIVEHYYTGSTVRYLGMDLPAPAPLWVNLERDRGSLELLTDAEVTVVHDWVSRQVPAGSRIGVRSLGNSQCELTISAPTGTETVQGGCWVDVFRIGDGGLTISNCSFRDWSSDVAVDRPCTYRHGVMHVRPASATSLHLVLEIDIEDYILGIAEMPYWWGRSESGGAAALQAQAIAARSYAHHLQLSRGDPSTSICGGWCHVRDTVWDQQYVGDALGGADKIHWEAAVAATRGQVLTHPEGNAKPAGSTEGIVLAYYSSSTGGRTEEQAEVWGGGQIPYLRSVDDHWSLLPANPNAAWTVGLPASVVAQRLGIDELYGATVSSVRTSGSAAEVSFSGRIGAATTTITRSGAWVSQTFGLRSQYFTVDLTGFTDIALSPHRADIERIAAAGITRGCTPDGGRFCPGDPVTRGEMAAFIARSLGLTLRQMNAFTDDDGSLFEAEIEMLAAAGITQGCAPGLFCPDQFVAREQMAAFLARALGLSQRAAGAFSDDDGSAFEAEIEMLAAAGITQGCSVGLFCPAQLVSREQMASFLARAFLI